MHVRTRKFKCHQNDPNEFSKLFVCMSQLDSTRGKIKSKARLNKNVYVLHKNPEKSAGHQKYFRISMILH